MRPVIVLAILAAAASLPAAEESDRTSLSNHATGQREERHRVVERGPHHKIWEWIEPETTPGEKVVEHRRSYQELTTGLHYREGDKWLESEAKIEILPNDAGAAAAKGQHKAIFPVEIKSGLIELAMPDNQWLRSRVWGLSYFDESTGESVLLAAVKESDGQLLGDNVVVYPDAFTDLLADIRYTYTLAGFEQDVVLREQPPAPETFGLNSKSTRLQVLTEFVEAPSPAKESTQAGGLVDVSLSFGQMSIGPGKGFSVDADGEATGHVPVAKGWAPLEGRDFLVEEVRYEAVVDQLQKLPEAKDYKGASLQRRGNGENVIAGLKAVMPKRFAKATPKPGTKRMAKATLQSSPSFVMDYVTLTTQPNFTFAANTNYYVSGAVNLSGTTTIEGGTVVKFASGTVPKINITGTIDCRTSMYRPAVFTAKDDNSIGEAFGTGSPGTTKYGSGLIFSTSGMALNNLRFSYADTAITLQFSSGQLSMTNMQFMKCLYPVVFGGSENTVNVDNSLFYCVTNITKGSYDNFLRGSHLTVHQCYKLFVIGNGNHNGEVHLTNSIFAGVYQLGNADIFSGSHNAFSNSPPFGYSIIPSLPAGVDYFQTRGAASHYLADNTYRNQGNTDLPTSLLTILKLRTTYPPTEIPANITTDTVWTPVATRDTDQPDIGYHYDPLDYVVGGRTVSANLTLTDGTAVGTYGAASWYGLGLSSGNLVSEGTATRLNWIVRYNTVQEQSTTTWAASSVGVGVKKLSSSATVKTRFTGWSVSGGPGDHFYDDTGGLVPSSFSHSQFGGGRFYVYPGSIALTNCLWERANLYLRDMEGDPEVYLFNNLFYGGRLEYRLTENPILRAYDNLFDQTTIVRGSQSANFTHGNNGYVSIAHLAGTSVGGDKDITSPADYLNGPLGRHYYPTIGTKLAQLIDTGSRGPVAAGLYHYTVKTAPNSKEGTDPIQTVDIGYHYVAVDAAGDPTDSDGDETPDYLEDTNGNGLTDGAETPWELPPSSLAITPPSQTVAVGGVASFTVSATGTTPFTYQWSFNGSPLANGTLPDGCVVSGAQTATLTLTSVALGRTGNYSVTVANSAGNPTTSAYLCVPQSIDLAVEELTHVRGSGASLIDATAAFAGNWTGVGVLTVQFAPGTSAGSDKLAIRNQGTASGNISINASTIRYGVGGGGTVDIGTFSGGLNGAPLQVTLLATVTDAALDALLRNLTYELDATQLCKPQTERELQMSIESGTACSGVATKTIIISCPVVEVVLIIDKSGSMTQGGSTKLADAIAAANHFATLLNMQPNGDKAGLVTFCQSAGVVVPLTTSENDLTTAINAISTCPGTDIKEAVEDATAHLMDPAYHVPGNKRVIVLLTDGDHNEPGDPQDAADDAIEAGIHLVTIGLQVGGSASAKLLEMASFKNDLDGAKDYYSVGPGQSLNLTYEQIAHSLCVPINQAPTFAGAGLVGANENADFNITYAMLQPFATDDGCSPIKFRFKGGLTGTLKYPGGATVPVGAMLATGETWVWRAPLNVDTGTDPNNKMVAFNVDAYDGELASGQGDVRISVLPLLDNNAPSVSAGKDRTVIKPSGGNGITRLEGFVSDDGLPSGSLTIAWSVVEAPDGVSLSSVIFTPSDSPTAQVSFPATGRYVLQLTADDGSGAVSDTVTVFICEGERRAMDIMLLGDRSESGHSSGGAAAISYSASRALQLIDFLPPTVSQIGLVSFSGGDVAFLQRPLTQDTLSVKNSTLPESMYGHFFSAIARAIRIGELELTGPRRTPGADPVMILFSDGETQQGADAVLAAVSAKSKGIRIIVVGTFNNPNFESAPPSPAMVARLFLQSLASSTQDYYELTTFESGPPNAEAISVFKTIGSSYCATKRIQVSAGADQTLSASGGPLTPTLSGTASSDAPISTYHWDPVPDWSTGTATINSPNSASTTITIPSPGNPGRYVFKLTATDTALVQGQAYVTIITSIGPINDYFNVRQESGVNLLDVLRNDPASGALKVAAPSGTFLGQVEVTPDGKKLSYTPPPDFGGAFELVEYGQTDAAGNPILDGQGSPVRATANILVTPVNAPPEAANLTYYLPPGYQTHSLHGVLDACSDPDYPEIRSSHWPSFFPFYLLEAGPMANGLGIASVLSGLNRFEWSLFYTTPGLGITGTDTFNYTIADTYGLTATGKVTVTLTYDPQLLGWKAIDDFEVINSDETSKIFDVLQNDEGAAPNVIESITAVSPASAGTAVILGTEHAENLTGRPVIKFTPPPNNRTSEASFSYRIVPGTNPDHEALVRVGFRAGTSSDAWADLTNLDPTGNEQLRIVREGILEVQGDAFDVLNPASFVKYYLAVYDPQNNELSRREYEGRVTAGVLGELDLTALPNGVYRIGLEVLSIPGGDYDEDNVYIMLDSPFKLGRFNLAYTDLIVPVEGVPVSLNRSYDSYDSSVGDFGKAWHMSIGGGYLKKSGVLGANWLKTTGQSGETCIRNSGQTVTINLGGSKELNFVARVMITANNYCVNGTPSILQGIVFDPAPGTLGNLAFVSQPSALAALERWVSPNESRFDIYDDITFSELYDTDEFVYTDPIGRQYTFKVDPATSIGRVTSIKNPHGSEVRLDFDGSGEGGIDYYPAPVPPATTSIPMRMMKIVSENGRITKAFGPSEIIGTIPTLTYQYQQYGSDWYLTGVKRLTDKTTDPANPVYVNTGYAYDYQTSGTHPEYAHYITKISGPSGAVRNEYDDEGRLIMVVDPLGAKTKFDYSQQSPPFESAYAKGRHIVTNPLGNSTTQEYDARGNIVCTKDALGNKTLREFDNKNHKTSEVRDLGGGQLLRTDLSYTYSSASPDLIVRYGVIPPHILVPGDSTRDQDSDFETVTLCDAFGRMTDLTDANGKTTHIEYVSASDVDPLNPAPPDHTDYVAAFAKVKSMTDAEGKTTTFRYLDLNSDTIPDREELDSLKNKTVTYMNALGYVQKEAFYPNTATAGNPPQYSSNPASAVENTYNSNGGMETETTTRSIPATTDKEKIVRRIIYDDASRVVTNYTTRQVVPQTGDPGPILTLPDTTPGTVYDEAGRIRFSIQSRTLPDGSKETLRTTYDYNARGELLRTTYPDGSFTESGYDLAGRRVSTTDKTGLTTRYIYDAVGRNIETIYPDKTKTSTEYDKVGRVKTSKDKQEVVTSYEYDESGRNKSVTTGTTTFQYFYDKLGNQETVKDPLLRETKYRHDELGRLIRVTHPDLTYQVTTYNDLGLREEEIDQAGVSTRFEYDALGLLTKVIKPYELYDMSGADPVQNPGDPADQTVTQFRYDELGNMLEQEDAEGRITKYEYDSHGRRKKRTLPGLGLQGLQYEELSYDEIGNVKTRRDFNGKITEFEYDSSGRPTKLKPDSTFNLDPVIFTYFDDGRRASMKYPLGPNAGSEEVTYHYQGERLWKKVTPQGTITYDYNDNGQLSSLATSHGLNLNYFWDAQNRLQFVDDTTDGLLPTEYTYDEPGNLKTVTYPNSATTTYNYNNLNRLTDMSVTKGGVLAAFNYNPNETDRTLGPTGIRRAARETINVTAQSVIQRNVNYDYDKLYRLTKETIAIGGANTVAGLAAGSVVYDEAAGYSDPTGYGFDKVGNHRSRTLQNANTALQLKLSQFAFTGRNYDKNDRIDTDSNPNNVNPNYDDNGNTLTGQVTPAQTAGDVYDFANRLITRQTTLDVDGDTDTEAATITIVYDGDGNRVRKNVTDGVTTRKTDFLVDDRNPSGYAQVLQEIVTINTGTPVVQRSYVYGHDLISQKQNGGTTHYYGYDGHGSVRFLLNAAGGITDAYNYEAFGILVDEWHAAAPTPNNYLFCGEQFDPDLGLYYLRARYMNPATGRFWTMDSYEGSSYDPQSLHKYLYANADPVNGIDPSGHETVLSTSMSSTIAVSLGSIYNGVVAGIGTALIFTVEGVQLGKSQGQILMDFVLEETGIQTGIDAFNFMKDWITSHFQDEETAAIIHYDMWREEVFLQYLVAMPDDLYGEFEINFELVEEQPQCFLAGTLVATELGQIPIEKLQLGDRVWAWNDLDQDAQLQPVVGLFVHEKSNVIAIRVGTDCLAVTKEHPFYLVGKGWTAAEMIKVGDELLTLDGQIVSVESVESLAGTSVVFNFEVETDHNYFVGDLQILTHNAKVRTKRPTQIRAKYTDFHHMIAFAHQNARYARGRLRDLGLTTEIPENLVELPKSVNVRKSMPGNSKFKAMTTHHGSGLHSKAIFDKIGDELAKVYKTNGRKKGKAIARDVLKRIAGEIQSGDYLK